MTRVPIRLRLALAFACTLALLLAGLGALVYQRHRDDLDAAIDQGLTANAVELQDLSRGGPGELAATRFAEPDETLAAILTASGDVADATPNVVRDALARAVDAPAARARPGLREVALPGFDSRVRLLAGPLGDGRIGVVGTALRDRDEALDALRRELLLAAAIAILVVALIAYAFAAAALRPVEAMRRRAAAISATRDDERLPVPAARDELRRLAETLNAMIARLRETVERERRFAADASHELRTPLALLRTELDLALDGDGRRDGLLDALRSASVETDRLIRLADDLLLLARADHDQLALALHPVDVAALLGRTVTRFAPAATAANRRIETHCPPGLAPVADEGSLERALANLVSNALQHGAGTITIGADRDPPRLRVTDEGGREAAGVDLFERFRRGPGGVAGGSGLGLAIVAAIAHAHGGEAGADSRPGRFEAWITLGPR